MFLRTALSLELFAMVLLTAFGVTEAAPPHVPAGVFTNPIAQQGQDPWVTIYEQSFYYCYAQDNSIRIKITKRLHLIDQGEPAVVWTAPKSGPSSKNIWAPELHPIDGRWYIYFAADDGDNRNHRMFVLRSEGDDPLGPYTLMGKIADPSNRWAIDGTVFLGPGGKRYFIWSGWPGETNGQQNLYIAPMSDPMTVSGERILISEPTLPWERASDPKMNEGPQVLRQGENVHLIFSAGGSWTDDYCLGRLTLTGDDPLAPGAWTKHPEPVFTKTGRVFGPGHASFIRLTNSNGQADWIVYHAAKTKGSGWVRDIRLQPFSWDTHDNPDFGQPIPPGVPIITPKTLESTGE